MMKKMLWKQQKNKFAAAGLGIVLALAPAGFVYADTNSDIKNKLQSLSPSAAVFSENVSDRDEKAVTEPEKLTECEESTESEALTECEESSELEDLTECEEESESEAFELSHFTGPAEKIYDEFLFSRELLGEKWSISIEDLKSGAIYGYNEDESMQSASVIKVFILAAVYDRVCYPSDEKTAIKYNENYPGELRAILEKMIRVSDNDCANAAIRILGSGDAHAGEEVVNDFCKKNGYEQTHLGRLFLESNPVDDNYTSAGDCRKILSEMYHGTLVNKEASEKMLDILKGQNYRWKLPAGLPEGYSVANKTGEMPLGYGLGCIENDIAIVFGPDKDYVVTVLSNELGGRNQEVQELFHEISERVSMLI